MGNDGNCRCSGTHCDSMVRHSGSPGRGSAEMVWHSGSLGSASAETARHSFVNGIG